MSWNRPCDRSAHYRSAYYRTAHYRTAVELPSTHSRVGYRNRRSVYQTPRLLHRPISLIYSDKSGETREWLEQGEPVITTDHTRDCPDTDHTRDCPDIDHTRDCPDIENYGHFHRYHSNDVNEHPNKLTNGVHLSQGFGSTGLQRSHDRKRQRHWYGFNLPTSERLRTRHIPRFGDVSNTKNRLLQQRQSSVGGDLIVSSGLIVRGFTEKTTSHGLPHVYFASGLLKKVVWSIISLTALVFLFLHLSMLITNWRRSEIGTKLTWSQPRTLTFPAVTICNYNPLKLSALSRQANLKSLIENSTAKVEVKGGKKRASLRNELIEHLAREYTVVSSEEFSLLGHNASELAIFCSFHGEECSSDDFVQFRDPRYGNCVTFNSGVKTGNGLTDVDLADEEQYESQRLKIASVAGPQYGLSLVVFVEQFDYIPVLTEAAGAMVVLHNQSVMPFPDQNSISVTANTMVNIGVRQRVHHRLSGKYGECTKSYNNTHNIYKDKYNKEYSLTACLKTCYQKEVVKQCRCYRSSIPYVAGSEVFSSLPTVSVCNNSIPNTEKCVLKVDDEYEDGVIKCDYCHQPCYEQVFDSSFSSAIWPANSYMLDFIRELRESYPTLMRKLENRAVGEQMLSAAERDAVVAEMVKSNFLRLNIYYDDMQVATYEEISIYDDFQFASDLGGSFGLWVGWSIISMVEFVELGLDILVFICYGACGQVMCRKQNRKPRDPETEQNSVPHNNQ